MDRGQTAALIVGVFIDNRQRKSQRWVALPQRIDTISRPYGVFLANYVMQELLSAEVAR
jgi:hypothetical protein